MAIQNHLASQLVHIFTDLGMLDHDDNHVNVGQERIQIVILVLDHILGDEGVVHLQTGCQMAFLAFQQLQRRRFAHIIHILLVGKT